MPKTVAILEGDSSGLVSSIQDAKVAMQKLEGEGRKLTDQLRDVADQADVAAGKLVQKIGGPTAIKAIAGVTAGFAAAQTALGAFTGSMQAFAATQGEKGAKAMADLDIAVNKLQGQLFTAVMGTDDLDEAMKTIMGVVDGLTIAFQALLTPVSAFAAVIRDLTTDHSSSAVQAREHAKAEDELATAMSNANAQAKTAHEGYANVERSIIGLIGTKRELAIFDLEETQRQYQAIILQQDRAMQARRLAAGDFAAREAETKKREELIAAETAKLEEHEARRTKIGKDGIRGMTADQIRAAAEARVENDKNAQLQIDQVRQSAREQSDARLTIQEAGFKEERERLIAAQQRIEAEKVKLQNAKDVTPRINTSAPAPEAAEKPVETADQKMLREMDEYFAKARAAQAEASAKTYADGLNAQVSAFRAAEAEKQRLQQETDDKAKAAQEELVKSYKATLTEYGQLAGQQFAAGEKASKVAEKMARKALGGQISALGDKAMAEAAILGAALNPLAIPMAAAGVAAYTAAAALGSDAKKATASTPAAAPAATQMNTNVSYNLQVDAAFANGESIARQFSMAQREAQRRGMLVPAGAF
jgi:hypothetical protein